MKTRHLLAALCLLTLPAFGASSDDYYRQGMVAINRGDEVAARRAFTEALRLNPSHANARYQLNKLPEMRDTLTQRKKTAELSSVKLPEVTFSGASLQEALEALNHMIEKESGKEDKAKAIVPNFMIQDPSGKLAEREVDLRLKNVPAKAVLDYLLQQAGATVRYDEHATVIRPASAAAKQSEANADE